MAVNVYEGMFIFDANRYSRDQAGVSGQIAEIIGKQEGEILASRLWEERRMAYPINGHRKGAYWLTYFKLDGGRLTDLNRQFKLSDSIMRTLILKVDPRIADALVSHALPAAPAAAAPAAAAPAAAAPAAAAPAAAAPATPTAPATAAASAEPADDSNKDDGTDDNKG